MILGDSTKIERGINYDLMKKAVHNAIRDKEFYEGRELALKSEKKLSKILGGTVASGTLVPGSIFGGAAASIGISEEAGLGVGVGMFIAGMAGTLGFLSYSEKLQKDIKYGTEYCYGCIRKHYIMQEIKAEHIERGLTEQEADEKVSKLVRADLQLRYDEYTDKLKNYKNVNGRDFDANDFISEEDEKYLAKQHDEILNNNKRFRKEKTVDEEIVTFEEVIDESATNEDDGMDM